MPEKKMKCDILLSDTSCLLPDMRIKERCSIAIRDGRILALCDATACCYEADTVLSGGDLLWMPGLIDAHLHTSQQLLRGRLLDEKPVIWQRVNVPFESRLTPELAELSAELAAVEMLRSGTTGFVDAGGMFPEVYAQVYRRAGLRGRLTVMTNDNPQAPATLRATSAEAAVERLRQLRQTLEGNLLPLYSVTTPTAVSEQLMRAVFEAAAEDGVPVQTHMNEYASEVTEFISHYGCRPFEWLERENLLQAPMLAAHGIFLSPEEIRIIAAREITVAHCPFSNCGKGVPPTPQLLAAGVSVCFGSDGAGHGGLDLFREMRLFRGVMHATRGIAAADSDVMPAQDLLRMATWGGAAALMLPDLGKIEPGCRADLIAIDCSAPHLWPTQNLVHSLIESACGADVRHSIVDGKLVMRERNVLGLDWQEISEKAAYYFAREPWLNRW